MTIAACAEIVRRGDADRFLATMAARPGARARLFPIYACNVEIARAPFVTREPLIAQMRLQWWRDALDEIAAGGPVRRHDVATPLAGVLDAEGARLLAAVATARERDIDGAPFADADALADWLAATAGTVMWTAARALGARPAAEGRVRATGAAQGLAAWFCAVPALRALGRVPLPDDRPDAVRALADRSLAAIDLPAGPAAAMAPARLARAVLRRAARDPAAVGEGRLAASEFARRLALLPLLLPLPSSRAMR